MELTGEAKQIAAKLQAASTLDQLMAVHNAHDPESVSAEEGKALSLLFGERYEELRAAGQRMSETARRATTAAAERAQARRAAMLKPPGGAG